MKKCLALYVKGHHVYCFGDKSICGHDVRFVHHCSVCLVGMVQLSYDGHQEEKWAQEDGIPVTNKFL